MSETKREILGRLSNGEIRVQQAEEELKKLSREKKKGFLSSLCGMDLCLDFGGDFNRIVLDEIHTGTLEQGPVELDLTSANGSIKVETWNSEEYRLTVKKRVRAGSEEEAEEITSEFEFAQIGGNTIKAGDFQSKSNKKISVSLLLQLPKRHPVEGRAKTANGSITVSGIENRSLQASSANGSVRLEDISGGEIQATTVNGSIKIEGETSRVEASTTNGSINLDSTVLPVDTRLRTVNGSVKVAIPAPPGTALKVTATTTSGRVTLDHPHFGHIRKSRGFGGKHIESLSSNWDQATVKARLDLSTVNGSIRLREADGVRTTSNHDM